MAEWMMQYWLDVLFGFILFLISIGYKKLANRQKESNRRHAAVEKGIQALLRDRMIQVYNHYMDKGFCPIYAMENVEALYKQYQTLGGNGTVTGLVERLRELPTEGE